MPLSELNLERTLVKSFLIIGSILAGFGGAVTWIAQGQFMSLSTTNENKGFYFGYFWAYYASSQIFGNLLGALLIEKTTGPTFFLIMGSIMMVAVTGFLFIKYPKNGHKNDNFVQIVNENDSSNQ